MTMKSFTTGQRPLQSYDDSQSYDTPNNDSMIQQHRSSYPTQNALVMLLNHAQSCSKKTLGRLIWNTSDFCPRRLARPSHGSLHGSAKTWAKSGQTKEIQSQTPPGHSIGLPGRTAAPERPLYKTTPGRFSAVLCQSHGVFGLHMCAIDMPIHWGGGDGAHGGLSGGGSPSMEVFQTVRINIQSIGLDLLDARGFSGPVRRQGGPQTRRFDTRTP